MLGAVAGDIVGSRFEWANTKNTDFELITEESTFTDDSVMTLAVAKWLLDDALHTPEKLVATMQSFGRKYPGRGYGGNFFQWLNSGFPHPYNSWGNGSGMRVSPVVFVAKSLDECLQLAKITAEVTHNHPEGIKGAQAIAAAAYLYREGQSKDDIKSYIESTFGYDLSKSISDIRPNYTFDVSCQGSCPQAIRAFLEGNTTEEVIRLAVSIGGDSDTIAAMAASISAAGAMGMTKKLATACNKLLTAELKKVVKDFEKRFNCTPVEAVAPKTKKAKKAVNVEEIGTSKELYNFLYEACNILRGPISHDAFKEYITPILYFKRISDVYDEETLAALELSDGDVEFAALPEQHRFVVPDGCHWADVRNRNEDLGIAIINAMRLIELANPHTLFGIFSVFSTSKIANKKVFTDGIVRDLIEHFSKRNLGNSTYNADLMGDAYEMLLKKFADESKAKAGEFYTPRSVVKLLVRILDPTPGETIYDPACGSGGMLIEAIHHMKNDSRCCGAIYGQEKNATNAAVCKMNLFLHGANDFHIFNADTLRNPRILQNEHLARFDCVIANPPFALKEWGSEAWKTDRFGRNLWGTPSDSCADYAWLQHMVSSMRSRSGRMAVVLPQGVLFRSNIEETIREKLIKTDYIEAVFALGDKLFYGTGLSPCFLILRDKKPEAHQGKILFVDGTKILTAQRAQNFLSDDDVDRLYELYTAYEDREDYSKVVALEDIKDNNLSPNRYVEYHKEAIRPYADVKAEFQQAYQNMLQCEARFRELMNL